MKVKFTLSLFLCLASILTLESYLTGLAGGGNPPRRQDRTGSPFTENTGTCSSCHNGGGFNPTLSIQLLDGDEPTATYAPEQTYKLRYTITPASGTPMRRGFQSVILSAETDDNVGTFGDAPSGMRVFEVEGRNYAEHSAPNTTTDFFEIDWTAPPAGTGMVKIYATGVAANGNGTNGGDNANSTILELEEIISSTKFTEGLIADVTLSPNPVSDFTQLQLKTKAAGTYQLQLINLSGQELMGKKIQLQSGLNLETLDLAEIPSGTYLLRLWNSTGAASTKLIKL